MQITIKVKDFCHKFRRFSKNCLVEFSNEFDYLEMFINIHNICWVLICNFEQKGKHRKFIRHSEHVLNLDQGFKASFRYCILKLHLYRARELLLDADAEPVMQHFLHILFLF